MATTYGNRWSITFKDFDQNTRTIYIQQAGGSGSVTPLIPGKNPMTLDEDNSEDLRKNVRGITGRIEVIEENYGDLSDIYPKYSTQLRVVCNTVFYGFIKAQNSTNAWEAGPRTLKLNILSPLALAYDIPMPINTALGLREVGSAMSDLLTTLGYSYLVMPGGTAAKGDFMRGSIRGMLICPYADDKDYHYNNDSEVFAPMSCGELLEAICDRHGLICHDLSFSMNAGLMFQRMKSPGLYYEWTTDDITNGNYDSAYEFDIADTKRAMLNYFTVCDDNNSEQLVRPYSMIDITHEGNRGDDNIPAPTKQSMYLGQDQYNYNRLQPRGVWLSNVNANVMLRGEWMPRPDTEGHDRDDYEVVDELWINPPSALADNTLLFTLAFYNVDPSMVYTLKMTYNHSGTASRYFRISARGKGGWFNYGSEMRPIYQNEIKNIMPLSSGASFEGDAGFFMIPDEYIIVNVYAGADLNDIRVWDIHLEGRPIEVSGVTDRYTEQSFVERFVGNIGSKNLVIKQVLNNTFFSNYYSTALAFATQEHTELLNSQRRIKITVKHATTSISFRWYAYKFYINNQNEIWKLLAFSRNVRDNTYTLTFHNSISF